MTVDGNHKNSTVVHVVCNWEYADEAARLAATGFTTDDVGKFAWQLDNNSIWVLADDDQACSLGALWAPVGIQSIIDLDAHPGTFGSGDKLVVNVSGTLYVIDFDDLPGSGSGKVLQVVEYETGAVATGTTVMVNDDTIPESTEGDEYMTLSITPQSASSSLYIDVLLHAAANGVAVIVGALFKDSDVSAIAAGWFTTPAANYPLPLMIKHKRTAGTTSAITFKVRAGRVGAGTMTLNGVGGARKFGGVLYSSIRIMEVAA